jgi:hypothetical protein
VIDGRIRLLSVYQLGFVEETKIPLSHLPVTFGSLRGERGLLTWRR